MCRKFRWDYRKVKELIYMKKYHKSKESIETLWTKLESVFDISTLKGYGKIVPHHKKNNESLNIRRPTNRSVGRSAEDSPEPSIIRSTTPSLSFTRTATTVEGLSQSQLKKLYHAKCEDLNIPVLPDQQFRFFSFCYKHFCKRKFEMQESGLGEISAKTIGEILADNRHFAYIILGKNMLGDQGCLKLVKQLKKNLTIVHLDISSNNITPEGAEEILKVLSSHSSLASLDVSSNEGLHRNRLCTLGASGLRYLFAKSLIISCVNVASTSIGEGLKIMLEPLKRCSSLTCLNLSDNSIGSECTGSLMESLEHSSIIDLDLSANSVCKEGAEAVGLYLTRNPSLEKLNLSTNGITTKGARKIFNSLSNNSHLKILCMNFNPLQNGPSDEIIYSLATNTTLDELDLSHCMLRNSGVLMVAECLSRNRSIKIMKLSGNGISDSGAEGLSISFTRNQSLKVVDLSCNNIKDPGAKFLSKGLRGNSSIEEINLKENSIKDEGGNHLADATRLNTNIIKLFLDLNQINSKCLSIIKQNITNNVEKYQRTLPQKLKKQFEATNYDENAIMKISQKISLKKKEKEDIRTRIEKNYEKLEEIKISEAEKLIAIKETLDKLKGKNLDLSKSLDSIQTLMMKCKTQWEKEIKELEDKNAAIDNEIKFLEKKSNF